ncbi:STAS/SEC14 domain-containing protein [Sandaracinus amylolyticus]|uniref:STAS/SEC14 domain-containing protein n=1 Tax=Sandaracinus amylolyticus TaxID=927083 RepID=UPI001F2DA8D7|nr:STAS/SEC14 domain-containing protein [Sandaracinus amylolyticus]UJR81685.1 Hypothetical protein I5071_37450 [Sandaracinus amylolyticus]
MSLGDALAAPVDPARERTGIHVAIDTWPRVRLTWPAGVRHDAEVADALHTLEAIAQRGRPFVLLVDARDARPPTPAQLGMMLDAMRRIGPDARCLAHAVVTRSAPVRAFVDSLRWMRLTPSAWAYFDDEPSAIAWLADEQRTNVRRRSDRPRA